MPLTRALVGAALAGLFSAAPPAVANLPEADEAPPELALADLSGTPRRLLDYRGAIVVLNFWATWCLPCREEMQILVGIKAKYGARGVMVIAASADDPDRSAAVERFKRKHGLDFPIWIGSTTEDLARFDLGNTLPATAIIDRDGTVAGRVPGGLDATSLEARIEWLLGDRAVDPPNLLAQPAGAQAHDRDHGGEADHHHGEDHQHATTGMEGASLVPS